MAEAIVPESIDYSDLRDFSSDNFSIDDIQSELYESGVVVVHNVITHEDCDLYTRQVHEWLNTFGNDFPINFSSLVHQYNISHIEPAWRARLQTKPLFAQLWGTDKLMSSFDGIATAQPPEQGQPTYAEVTPRKGLHLDQGKRRHGLHAYQGALYLEEAQADDWCFVVMETSHKLHSEFFQEHDVGRSEHRKLSEDEIDWYLRKECYIKRIPVPKGGMVLWDSRLVHAGAPPVQGRRNPNRWRYVIFVCQTPAVWATPKDLQIKKDAYDSMLISQHWASNGVANFKYEKSRYDLTAMPACAKTDEAKLLAGVKPYNFDDGNPNGPKWKPKWI